jgi:polysaccharide deacetylase family protein (PEP-CTERM system associated)
LKNPIDTEAISPRAGDESSSNILTIDVEDWYHVNYKTMNRSTTDTGVSTVYDNTMDILDILDQTSSKATFFVLGCVARAHPRLIQAIDRGGHELACHGDVHELVYEQSPEEFRRDLRRAVDSITAHTGKGIIGFRAPSWSITERNLWALDIIAEEGFLYDSSVFPLKNYMYGIRNFPVRTCWITTSGGRRLIEVPATAAAFGRIKVPCGGGIYLRLLPLWAQKRLMASAHAQGRPFMLYFHPSDIDERHLQINLSIRERFFHNVGRRGARGKIMNFLESFHWTSIRDSFSWLLLKTDHSSEKV